MSEGIFDRTKLLLGTENFQKIETKNILIFGVGGVGGFAAEALVRSGIHHLTIVDNDTVNITNINRQIIATTKTVGQSKVLAMKNRLLEINPQAQIEARQMFFLPENSSEIDFTKFDYVIDAIDTVKAKVQIVLECQKAGIKLISCMGAGNKLDATAFRVADIYKTSMDPLARVMRRELKKRGVKKLKVVYSQEQPIRPVEDMSISCRTHCICPPGAKHKCTERRDIPGSTAFVPSVVGLIIAGEIVRDISGK